MKVQKFSSTKSFSIRVLTKHMRNAGACDSTLQANKAYMSNIWLIFSLKMGYLEGNDSVWYFMPVVQSSSLKSEFELLLPSVLVDFSRTSDATSDATRPDGLAATTKTY